jgi:tRNA(His) 5'-end guanylyltransferase
MESTTSQTRWLKKWLNFRLPHSTRKTYQENQARFTKFTGLEKPIDTAIGGLENRCASHLCHQRLDPMIEAHSNEGAFLVSETPHIGKAQGWVLVTVSESLLILAGFRGRLSVGR